MMLKVPDAIQEARKELYFSFQFRANSGLVGVDLDGITKIMNPIKLKVLHSYLIGIYDGL